MGIDEQSAQIEDAGLAALVLIARIHGIAADAAQLRHEAAVTDKAFPEAELVLSARRIGLKARAISIVPERIARTPLDRKSVV